MVERSSKEQANRRLVVAVYEHVLQPLDSSRVDEFFAPGYIQHNPVTETGSQGLKRFLNWAREQTPKAVHHVKRVFVDGDYVVAHVHVIVHPGDSGNAVVDIFRIEDGLIAEHWDVAQPLPPEVKNTNGMF
jgi:predicted SnoaL-like aldol condensation-catalyzing enzyme